MFKLSTITRRIRAVLLMKKSKLVALLIMVGGMAVLAACSTDQRPVAGALPGDWRSLDTETGDTRSIVRFSETNGAYSGRVIKLFHPETPDELPLCRHCKGELKGKPVVGMTVIQGLKREDGRWTGGTLLNPDTGKRHAVSISLIEDGNTLKIVGTFFNRYRGSDILGRRLTWERVRAR